MDPATTEPPTQRIYRGHGTHSVRMPFWEADEPAIAKVPTIADIVPACRIMSREVICAREDLEVAALMDLFVRHHIGCVPIVDDRGHPIGMVTKLDLVEQLICARDPEPAAPALVASQVMMPLALTLDERATVAHAAALMSIEAIHHVPIVAGSGCLIGVISSMDVVRWLASNDGVPGVGLGHGPG